MSSLDQSKLAADDLCFACGADNEHGLKMKVYYGGELAKCRLTLPQHFQGWVTMAHGGVVTTILDEIMSYAILEFAGQGVTMRLETVFRKPVPLGTELMAFGWTTNQRGRVAEAAGEVRLADNNTLLAQASGRWLLKLGPDGKPVPRPQ